MNKLVVTLYLFFLVVGCDGGLSPTPPFRPGFGGTVYFAQGTWPSQGNIKGLWVYASEVYPIRADTVFALYVAGKFQLYPTVDTSLPYYVDSVDYEFRFENPERLPINFRYVGVLHWIQGELLPIDTTKYDIVGIYHEVDPNVPKAVIVKEFQFVQGINIYVDFHKLPPQPF